jgi:hypothetical protein
MCNKNEKNVKIEMFFGQVKTKSGPLPFLPQLIFQQLLIVPAKK